MRVLLFVLFGLLTHSSFSQEYYLLVGNYDSPKSEGVYVFRFNSQTGESWEISHVKTSNPSFIAVSPDERYVYAVHEVAPADGRGGDIAAFAFNKQNGALTFINRQLSGGDHPCHVEVDRTGKWVFAANYSGGSLSVLPVNAGGSLGEPTTIKHTGSGPSPRQKSPHVHGNAISPDNRFLVTTDLGTDKVMIYAFDAVTGNLSPGKQPYVASKPGSGPRLFTFPVHSRMAYAVEELSGSVVAYRYDYLKGRLKTRQRISTLPARDTSFAGSADIHVAPGGRFLYASNRGNINNIAIYRIKENGKLRLLAHQSTLGKTPRNFSIDPSGNYLLAANQNSDEIVVFKRDKETGLLTDTGKRIQVGKPVCLKWVKP